MRVDRFLAQAYPFLSRQEWNDLCRDRHLIVNGRPVRPAHRLQCGDQVSRYHPLTAEPEVDDGIELLARQGGLIAVYKPASLPMHESGLHRRRTFKALLEEQFGREWAPVHRLDRETSGILVCAADPRIRRELSAAFEARAVDKRYVAILQGSPVWESTTVDQPLGLDESGVRPRHAVIAGGAPAITDFEVLERGPTTTLVNVKPRTGKTNQIRVHAAWLGHALVGDKVYHPDLAVFAAYHANGDTPAVRALAGFPRHALHAAAIRLRHPEDGSWFEAESPLPADLVAYWQQARRHA